MFYNSNKAYSMRTKNDKYFMVYKPRKYDTSVSKILQTKLPLSTI